MPFPLAEEIRKAIETSIRDGLEATGGEWTATLDDGQEVDFRPAKNGKIEILYTLPDAELETLPEDKPAEKTYRFRVAVEYVVS